MGFQLPDIKTTSRGDLGGIDNEALDFSQLEEYINDDNESNIYFHEALVGSELKLSDPSKDPVYSSSSANTTTRGHASGEGTSSPLAIHLAADSPALSHVVSTNGHSGVVPGSVVLGKAGTFRNRGLPVSTSFPKPHHLPDSPPDSGSEPPFSPPNEDRKLNSTGPSSEMLQQVPVDSLKHYITYGHTQPLKHLSDAGLSIASPHQQSPLQGGSIPIQSPHSASLPLLSIGPPNSPGGQILSQLPQSILTPLVGNTMQQQQPLVAPSSGHMASLYAGGEEFLYDNLTNPTTTSASKKRKLSGSPKPSRNLMNGVVHVKTEPVVTSPEPAPTSSVLPSGDDDYSFDLSGAESGGLFLDANYQCIRFQPFQQNTWVQLIDRDMKEMNSPNFRVDADKGFNYSNADESFVCQKKNHFQVTVHVQPVAEAHYVRTSEGVKRVEKFFLHFHGVKMESPTQTIKVEQSQSDRSKKPFNPVALDMVTDQVTKTTVGRLHFSETTSNNMRKKGKPNPDQRFFLLVVSLCAHVAGETSYPVVAHASEKIIVRASNPGQFENDMELSWQKGHTPDSIFHAGRVGINTDRPEESLVVHGNIKVTGHIVQPSDLRAKVDVQELDTKEQLRNVASMRIVRYRYLPEFGHHVGVTHLSDTGVIAQEVQHILPDAVLEAGDVLLPDGRLIDKLLVVNKERIFMENVGAVKELCKVTDNLENRIDELERINRKLSSIKRKDSIKSNSTDTSRVSSVTSSSRKRFGRHGKRHLANHIFCSSRFVQATIVILVLVMAFCLIAMATLYIMEWQKRHTVPFYSGPTITERHSSSSSVSSSQSFEWRASSLNPFPSSEASISLSPDAYQASLSSSSSDGGKSGNLTSRSTSANPSPTIGPTLSSSSETPYVIGLPLGCEELSTGATCPIFCCAAPQRGAREEDDLQQIGDVDHHRDIKRGADGGKDIGSTERVRQSTETQFQLESPTNRRSLMDGRDLSMEAGMEDHQRKISGRGSEKQREEHQSSRRRSNFIERSRKMQRRAAEEGFTTKHEAHEDDLNVRTPPRLLELNVSLTSDMCDEQRLGSSSRRLTCLVLLSRHLALENLTLHFSFQNHLTADFCGEDPSVSCPQQPSIDKTESYSTVQRRQTIQGYSWSLPVGFYLKSSYRFRFMKRELLADGHQPCSLSAGRPYIEYVIMFQRRCDK